MKKGRENYCSCIPTAFIHQLYNLGVPCTGLELRLQAPEDTNSADLNKKGTSFITYNKTHNARVALGMVA